MKFFKKEKHVSDLALAYLETVEECVATAENSVLDHLAGRRDTANTLRVRAGELESAADELRRNIGDTLFSGAYLPHARGNIYSIIDQLDGVPNAAEACCAFFTNQNPEIPDDLRPSFETLVRLSCSTVEPLGKAVRRFFKPKGKPEDIREHATLVGIRESEVDQLEWTLTERVFSSAQLDLARKMHLKRAIDRIVSLSDRAEDAAERLEFVSLTTIG